MANKVKNTYEARVEMDDGAFSFDGTFDARDCELISDAFMRAARAILDRENGGITTTNHNGNKLVDITVYDTATCDDSGRTMLSVFSEAPVKKRKAKRK